MNRKEYQAKLKWFAEWKSTDYQDLDRLLKLREFAAGVDPRFLVELLQISHYNGVKEAANKAQEAAANLDRWGRMVQAIHIDGYNEPGDTQPEPAGGEA